jgi:RHS repeat-associated protein
MVLDEAGNVHDRVRYTAGGEVRQRTGSSPMAFGYGGYLTQQGTDELYAFARTYSPSLARFNQVDPLREFDPLRSMGSHRYVLGYGNPISYVDPDGRCPWQASESECFEAMADSIGADLNTREGMQRTLALQVEQSKVQALALASVGGIAASGATLGAGATAGLVGLGASTDVAMQMNLDGKAYDQVDYERAIATGGITAGAGPILGRALGSGNAVVSGGARVTIGGAAVLGAGQGGQLIGEGLSEGDFGKVSLGTSFVAGSLSAGPVLSPRIGSGELDASLGALQPKVGAVVTESPSGTDAVLSMEIELATAVASRAEAISTSGSSQYLTRSQRGPVLTGAMDPQTGEIFYGLNQGKVPDDLHPVLQRRLDEYLDASGGRTPERAGIPGSHSEIVALDQAIKARELRLGIPVTEDMLPDFLLSNRALIGERRIVGVPPRCANCAAITNGVRTVGGD